MRESLARSDKNALAAVHRHVPARLPPRHVILLGFVVSLLATVPLKSLKVIASVFAGFGTIFLVAPYTTMPQTYVLAGIPMILIGALLWTMAGR